MRILIAFLLFSGIAFSQGNTKEPTGLVGTKWRMVPVGADLDITELLFLPGGKIFESDMTADEVDDGRNEWSQKGNKITIYYNEHYSTYKGKVDGNIIKGKAKNITGKKWTWTATLIEL